VTGRETYRLLAASVLIALISGPASAITLTDRLHSNIREGNRRYEDEKHEEALEFYLRAQEEDSTHSVPRFNAGDALYRLGRFGEGAGEFLRSASSAPDSISAMSYYNLGNSMFRAGDIGNAAEAYKKSLLMNPDDEDAKYNLEYALRMLEQQSQEDRQDKQDEKDQDQQSEQQDREQRPQEEDEQDEQKRPEQQDEETQPPEEGQQQQSPREITPEELERILAAIEASDKDTQKEMIRKASRHKRITGKDW
jgi:Ca-activated chloride channel family protein